MKAKQCVNCGAPVERTAMKCDYCGTSYCADNHFYLDPAIIANVPKLMQITGAGAGGRGCAGAGGRGCAGAIQIYF